ncbi:MAG: cation:proton antiporter [Phycisphaerales bacterium JB039]
MDLWTSLLDLLILLGAAMLLGALCERLRQNAILGYLLAGTLLGPNALDLLPSYESLGAVAELGVALLLFTIGLEFSWRTLRRIGGFVLAAGTLQVAVTGAVTVGACAALGVAWRPSIVVGAMVALSSTAFVLRLLVSRAEIDSMHGRTALGILLLQDVAVIPLALVVSTLAEGDGASIVSTLGALGWSLLVAMALVGALYMVLNDLMPLLMSSQQFGRSRDVPVLLAIVTAIGAAWLSHKLGLSPVLGAFIAGLMLAESPFATQIHADVAPLRSLFVTLFFSSIGLLGNPAWALEHWVEVSAVVIAIIAGKVIITSSAVRLAGASWGHAVASGACLAQVGEFSFVLAALAQGGGLLEDELFELMLAATIVTLLVTPALVAGAPRLARMAGRWGAPAELRLDPEAGGAVELRDHILVIGFGPAGQGVAESLMRHHKEALVVLELNRKTLAMAQAYGLRGGIGDATQRQVLEHAGVHRAWAVVVTVPEPEIARRVVALARSMAPQTAVVVRARYHVHLAELMLAGAEVVIDEEHEVGRRMAAAVRRAMRRE